MKKGFTLAEVLITLAIIGVVAAMTIPTLIVNYQKREFASRLSQTFSILSNAVKMAQVEYGDVASWGYQKYYGTTGEELYTVELNNGTTLFFNYNGVRRDDVAYRNDPVIYIDVNGKKILI